MNEIAERLALPKTTVYYWIKDLSLGRERNWSPGQRKGTQAMQKKCRLLRETAYAQGLTEFDELVRIPTFRDFLALYIAEGYKRSRNRISIGNSDARVVCIAASWLRVLSRNTLSYSVQYHADQDLDDLKSYWAGVLRVDASMIRLQRKSNSGNLAGRMWRSRHGVLTVVANDTLLRARLQAWIDRIRDDWGLDSACPPGRGAAW